MATEIRNASYFLSSRQWEHICSCVLMSVFIVGQKGSIYINTQQTGFLELNTDWIYEQNHRVGAEKVGGNRIRRGKKKINECRRAKCHILMSVGMKTELPWRLTAELLMRELTIFAGIFSSCQLSTDITGQNQQRTVLWKQYFKRYMMITKTSAHHYFGRQWWLKYIIRGRSAS